jgi:hypothetical protein
MTFQNVTAKIKLFYILHDFIGKLLYTKVVSVTYIFGA